MKVIIVVMKTIFSSLSDKHKFQEWNPDPNVGFESYWSYLNAI